MCASKGNSDIANSMARFMSGVHALIQSARTFFGDDDRVLPIRRCAGSAAFAHAARGRSR
jgi:hypothetical protein